MKKLTKTTYTGNLILIVDGDPTLPTSRIFLGRKCKKQKGEDASRHNAGKHKRVAAGLWTAPGGRTEKTDSSQKMAAKRECFEETGLRFPVKDFEQVGLLTSYIGEDAETPTWSVIIYRVIDPSAIRDVEQRPVVWKEIGWFEVNHLPRDMIASDKEWLPQLFHGQYLSITVRLDETGRKTTSVSIRQVLSFG